MPLATSKYRYIDCDPDLCIGCQICEYVCSYTKTGEYNTYRCRIRTVRVDEDADHRAGLPHLRECPLRDRLPAECADPAPRSPASSWWTRRNATPAPGASKPVILAPSRSTLPANWPRCATNAKNWRKARSA